jgi:uncharacterized protein YciI
VPGLALAQDEEMAADYYVVVMELEEGADQTETGRQAMAGHVENLGVLYDEGILVLAGPFMDDSNAGALVLEADSADEARAIAEEDPAVQNGVMQIIAVHPWWTPFDRAEGKRMSLDEFAVAMAAEDDGEGHPDHAMDHAHGHGDHDHADHDH